MTRMWVGASSMARDRVRPMSAALVQQAARNLCRSAGSMVAQMEDMDAKELKELTALLRELVTLEERTDKGPETVKVVLAKEAEEWSR